MTPIISKTEMAALLGRSLSDLEDTNFDLYLKIAILRLEDLLCFTMPNKLPVDLELLLARCFGAISQEQSLMNNHGIDTKKVEDFSISFNADAESPMAALITQNSAVIAKYSECQAKPRAGGSCRDCIRCI